MIAAATACGGGDSGTTLTWYINPDPPVPDGVDASDFGQPGIAKRCSTSEYTIKTQTLPSSGSEQRIQLARRLASEDAGVDLMSLDTPFTAEFADAGFLADIPDDIESAVSESTLQGAIDGAMWDDQLAVVPLWSNTQLLWYRKSTAEAAGLDMTQPVTWDQIIDAASETNAKVGVQANKYEGYVVLINALVQGAGGQLIENTEAGLDATMDLDSEAAADAAGVLDKLAHSPAAEADLSTSNEGTVLGPFAEDGGFQVNWTFIFQNYAADAAVSEDLGWARYPQTVEGEESKPPIGGINIGVGAYGGDTDAAMEAVQCITSLENQVQFAIDTGQMPAQEAAYDDPALAEIYPTDLLELYRESIDAAGPRPATPYWAKIVIAILNEWHPASGVDPDSTPADSQSYVDDVLSGDALS